MVFVKKSLEPPKFSDWKKNHPNATEWKEFKGDAKDSVKLSLLEEQGYVCGYCGRRVSQSMMRIDHVAPKSLFPSLLFDYGNFCGSCDTAKIRKKDSISEEFHCDERKNNRMLSVTPYDTHCSEYFYVDREGRLLPRPSLSEEKKAAVKEVIDILGLNDTILPPKRKKCIEKFRNHHYDNSKTREQNIIDFEQPSKKNVRHEYYFVPRLHYQI